MAQVSFVFTDESGTNLNQYKVIHIDDTTIQLTRDATITQRGTALDAEHLNEIVTAVNSKANLSDLTNLRTRVTTIDDTVSSLGTRVSTLETNYASLQSSKQDKIDKDHLLSYEFLSGTPNMELYVTKTFLTQQNYVTQAVLKGYVTLDFFNTSFDDYTTVKEKVTQLENDVNTLESTVETLDTNYTSLNNTVTAIGSRLSTAETSLTKKQDVINSSNKLSYNYLTDTPNISDWALQSTKPTYTATEVKALPISGGTLTGRLVINKDGTTQTATNAGHIALQRSGTEYGRLRLDTSGTNLNIESRGNIVLYGANTNANSFQSTNYLKVTYNALEAVGSMDLNGFKNLSMSGSITHGTYNLTLPNKAGTIALISDIPNAVNVEVIFSGNKTITLHTGSMGTITGTPFSEGAIVCLNGWKFKIYIDSKSLYYSGQGNTMVLELDVFRQQEERYGGNSPKFRTYNSVCEYNVWAEYRCFNYSYSLTLYTEIISPYIGGGAPADIANLSVYKIELYKN